MTTLLSPLPLLAAILACVGVACASKFDVWPHPKYWGDDFDCSPIKQNSRYENRGCEKFTNGTWIDPNDHHAGRPICVEFRLWWTSHCVFEKEKCTINDQNFQHVGMCNHPSGHKIWGTKLRKNYDRHTGCLKFDEYCAKADEMLCTVYQRSYENLCRLEYDWCENQKLKGYYEIFDVHFNHPECDNWDAGESMFDLKQGFTKQLIREELVEFGYGKNAHATKSPVLDDAELKRIWFGKQ